MRVFKFTLETQSLNHLALSLTKYSPSPRICPLPSGQQPPELDRSEDTRLHFGDTTTCQPDTGFDSNFHSRDSTANSLPYLYDNQPSSNSLHYLTHDQQQVSSPRLSDFQPAPRDSSADWNIMDMRAWFHVVNIPPPPIDMSDDASRLVQYERYISAQIDPLVTGYIMANTPLFIPDEETMKTIVKGELDALTPEYIQQFTYFTLRLEGIIHDLQDLSFNHLYWNLKRNRLVKHVTASHEWLRRKMEERLEDEHDRLFTRQRLLENRIIESSELGEDKQEEREPKRRMSYVSNSSSRSSMDEEMVRVIEAGIQEIFIEDATDELASMQRWDAERSKREAIEAMNESVTHTERMAEEIEKEDKLLQKYIGAGVTPLKSDAKPQTITCPYRPSTSMRQMSADMAAEITDSLRRRNVHFEDEDSSPVTPSPRGGVSIPSSAIRGSFAGSPYERTWTTPERKTDADADASSQADVDVFFEASTTPTPAPRNSAANVPTKQVAEAQQKVLRESSHPYRALKSPLTPSSLRVKQFYASLAERGIRITTAPSNFQGPKVAQAYHHADVSAPVQATRNATVARPSTEAHAYGQSEEKMAEERNLFSSSPMGPPRTPRAGPSAGDQGGVIINLARVKETLFAPTPVASFEQNHISSTKDQLATDNDDLIIIKPPSGPRQVPSDPGWSDFHPSAFGPSVKKSLYKLRAYHAQAAAAKQGKTWDKATQTWVDANPIKVAQKLTRTEKRLQQQFAQLSAVNPKAFPVGQRIWGVQNRYALATKGRKLVWGERVGVWVDEGTVALDDVETQRVLEEAFRRLMGERPVTRHVTEEMKIVAAHIAAMKRMGLWNEKNEEK